MKKCFLALLFSFFLLAPAAAQRFRLDTLLLNGKHANRIDLVILGDGYQADEMPKFETDAQNFFSSFFLEPPFGQYKNYFNVFAVQTPSNQSGAGHPGTATDVEEPKHPVSEVDNYYGSVFDGWGIHRLLVIKNKPRADSVLAASFPLYDLAVMLVNSPFYGGSGGEVPVASTDPSSSEVALHEIGHAFVGLKDEYWAGKVYASEGINMTAITDTAEVKWKRWAGYKEVGLYQYCCGEEAEVWYKPHRKCKMETLKYPFCPVCTEGIVEKIHSLASPIDGQSPTDSLLQLGDVPLRFSLQLTEPSPNTLKTQWYVNGRLLPDSTAAVSLGAEVLNNDANLVEVYVADTTELIRSLEHSTYHRYTVAWKVKNPDSGRVVKNEEVKLKTPKEAVEKKTKIKKWKRKRFKVKN